MIKSKCGVPLVDMHYCYCIVHQIVNLVPVFSVQKSPASQLVQEVGPVIAKNEFTVACKNYL